tara:strand:+ start:1649 stop:2026 length:378 start_codon:yes stop_codon:yes gene_type:complete
MKLDEFKKLLKPMIKDMVKQALVEEGLLSSVVSEVARGLVLAEVSKPAPPVSREPRRSQVNEAVEAARRDLQTSLQENNTVFEGTQPIASGDQSSGALSGIAPNDPGVDIDGLLSRVEHKWSKLL